jgi:hypothetical protein
MTVAAGKRESLAAAADGQLIVVNRLLRQRLVEQVQRLSAVFQELESNMFVGDLEPGCRMRWNPSSIWPVP